MTAFLSFLLFAFIHIFYPVCSAEPYMATGYDVKTGEYFTYYAARSVITEGQFTILLFGE